MHRTTGAGNPLPTTAATRRVLAGLCLVLGLGLTGSASADGAALDQYGASETMRDGFAVSRPRTPGDMVVGAVLHLDYGNDPLVVESVPGDSDSEVGSIVKHLMTGHLGLSLGLGERWLVFGGFRASLINAGDAIANAPAADGRGFGDSFLGGRVHLLGNDGDLVNLGGQLTVNFPTANLANDKQQFTGDSFGSVVPEALLEISPGRLRLNAVAGVRIREAARFGNVDIGQELLYTLGATYPLAQDVFDLHAEVYGSTSFSSFLDRESTPLEAIGGGKYYFGRCFVFGAAGGLGILRGYGAPDLRVVGTLGWENCPPPPAPEPPPVIDSDLDGLLDPDDQCPFEAEDRDGFEDEEGCPDPDNDKDGVLDVEDACPMDAEDKDGFEDENGCPDPDNDKDGLADISDQCPMEPEDKDDFEDEDGCPDPDNDKDGVLDVDDQCPMEPGVAEAKGCPQKIRVEEGRIVILDRVEFATNKDVILEGSVPILEEVRATLEANRKLEKLRIEGHTDDRGRDKKNMDLSRRRARSVGRWLVEHGIDASRFEAFGCGETRPVGDNKTDAGRQENRRVEFHILGADSAPPSVESCEQIDL